MRLPAGIGSLATVVTGLHACTPGCPRDPDPERAFEQAASLRVSTAECAERLAEEVCTWDATKHAERKRSAERVAESDGPGVQIGRAHV